MASNLVNNVNISSFNTHGFKSNALFVNNLIKHNDILFLSEHWLSSPEILLLNDVTDQHQIVFHAASKNLQGRPFGGNCFFIRKNLFQSTETIYEDHNIISIKV